ncbi:MAG: hypothetical protein AB7I59_17975 [Geminicoccaceae bacterium]
MIGLHRRICSNDPEERVVGWRDAMFAFLRAGLAICGTALAAVVAFPDAASAAAVIKTQPPCNSGGDTCFNFGVGIVGVGQFDIRDFTFKAPSKGTAQVSFHGSLLCAADLTAGSKVVDLVTQIVNSTTATASPSGPGGLRQALVIPPNTSDTLNLASTRVFTFNSAGSQIYRYRVRPLRIDSGANCYIYNATFSVVFVP